MKKKRQELNKKNDFNISKTIVFIFMTLLIFIPNVLAQKQMEQLNRGVLAVRTSSNEVLVSWRIFGTEFAEASYNVYRGTTLLNSSPITGASNFVDVVSTDEVYCVTVIIGGVEQEKSEAVDVWGTFYKSVPITAPAGGTTPDGISYTYEANDASVGDLDGDGDYEIVLKWMPTNSKDNSQSGYTGNTILQGLEMDGTVLWTIDLGINIRSGAHYTQFMVYDLDGDGKAEVACKTADGTKDGQGNVLGSSTADYRTQYGYILSGPEYFCVFSGETGAAIKTESYIPARGSVSDWGDNYGNRVDRFLACIAYLDGERPSLIFSRGYYTRVVIAAWDYRDGELSSRWVFDTNTPENSAYYGQGNHNITVGDVDSDGKDEIQFGSCAIDDDGTGLYSTGFGHGDASHLGDFNPARPGLEYFMSHEEANGTSIPGLDYRDPNTGTVLWSVPASGDIGRGIIADIDPNYLGAESWGSEGSGVYSADGTKITTTYPTTGGNGRTYNMCAWYDGDLLRELVDKTVITKWNAGNDSTDRILTSYNYNGSSSNNGSKSNPCLIADIMGDWREEIIWRKFDNTALNIFTTPNETTHRIYSLMHDPLYRTSIAWQNVGYNQPAHTSFYLGHGMETPETPDIYLTSASRVADIDNDGVLNDVDVCPNTAAGEIVDTNGCSEGQRDDDNDGVQNSDDVCPDTPALEDVDANGCGESQLDDDEDGVFNNVDSCSNTPAGEVSDANGCGASQLDDDGDSVMNDKDKCNSTPVGTTVDTNGCFTLPSNIFTIKTTSETCPEKDNGEISISTTETKYTYTTTINGVAGATFTNKSDFVAEGLAPGIYKICIGVNATEGAGFEQCFEVEIISAEAVLVAAKVTTNKATIEIKQGTAPYTVYVNGLESFMTSASKFSVAVKHGDVINVKTAKSCEGIFSKMIELSDSFVAYPNPTNGLFEIVLPISQGKVTIELYTIHSQLISVKTYPILYGSVQLNIENQPTGLYLAKIQLDSPVTLKIIKQ